jgi:DNA-binding CsgD family transcriptional regulator
MIDPRLDPRSIGFPAPRSAEAIELTGYSPGRELKTVGRVARVATYAGRGIGARTLAPTFAPAVCQRSGRPTIVSCDNIGGVLRLPELPDTLTAKEREIWTLHSQGMSQRSLAALLGVTRSTIRDTLQRAQLKIARASQRELEK